MSDPKSVATLLEASWQGDATANQRLAALLYDDLRGLARSRLAGERSNHTLEVTDLVNEACARLIDRDGVYDGRSHFMAIGALTLRQVLVDHERQRRAGRRDVARNRALSITQHDTPGAPTWAVTDFVDLLERLARQHPRQARVVELKFLGGLADQEIAEELGVSDRTIRTDWRYARAWLQVQFDDTDRAESHE